MSGSAEESREKYERAFRSLLWRVRPRRLQRGVDVLIAKYARALGDGMQPVDAFHTVYRRAREQIVRYLVRARFASNSYADDGARRRPSPASEHRFRVLLQTQLPDEPNLEGPDFCCDAGLGGLARWLRAAGYMAYWSSTVADDDLLTHAGRTSAILLTNDTRLAARGVFQYGMVPSMLVPITLKKRDQFALVTSRLGLPRRTPRCMACGGVLMEVDKQAVRDRIPPRTFPWRDRYWVCQECDRLFWEGSHWPQIEATLRGCDQLKLNSES